ncbi:hypothetical protein FACS1894201_07120 [Bacteroidia bacterium]|nr:hypothetical protein FACS1894201_07120 [Bacteroidia bacterium]
MKDYIISGIQQIGIGVENFSEAWTYYIDVFGMDVKILEDNTVAERMLPYTGNQPQKRRAAIVINMQGGSGFEVWQYSERKPQKATFEIAFGDLGVLVAKMKSRNVQQTYNLFSHNPQVHILGGLNKTLDGNDTFFVQDPFGNLFQIVQDTTLFRDEHRLTGGPVGAIVGCSDIDKTLPMYQDILGYDKVIADQTGNFDDIKALPSGDCTFRRVLLTHSKPRVGGFSQLLGTSYIELVQILNKTPKKIYEGRYWGDPGFIQICFDVNRMDVLKAHCEQHGYPFTVDSHANQHNFDMGEASGRFTYIEDPDGTLIEFVETHKIPILKKLGIYLHLKKRNPEKPINKRLLGLLRFMRTKPNNE